MALTNNGLVSFAKKILDLGEDTLYIYGTFGQKVTSTLIEQKAKQYTYNVSRKSAYTKAMNTSGTEYGFDCIGLIKAYLWGWNNGSYKYNSAQDVSANGMYNKATKKGSIKTMPEKVGLAVHMDAHIGIYIGNGYVIESTPSKTYAKQSHGCGGVCKTKLSDRKWEHWLEIPFITYEEEKKQETTNTSTTEKTTTTTTKKNDFTKVGNKVTMSASFKVSSSTANAKAKKYSATYEKGEYKVKKVSDGCALLTNSNHTSGGWYKYK